MNNSLDKLYMYLNRYEVYAESDSQSWLDKDETVKGLVEKGEIIEVEVCHQEDPFKIVSLQKESGSVVYHITQYQHGIAGEYGYKSEAIKDLKSQLLLHNARESLEREEPRKTVSLDWWPDNYHFVEKTDHILQPGDLIMSGDAYQSQLVSKDKIGTRYSDLIVDRDDYEVATMIDKKAQEIRPKCSICKSDQLQFDRAIMRDDDVTINKDGTMNILLTGKIISESFVICKACGYEETL